MKVTIFIFLIISYLERRAERNQAHADLCPFLHAVFIVIDFFVVVSFVASAKCLHWQVWDAELSVVAQAHADQCKFAHDCADCRRVTRFGVGQNLYIYKQARSLL